MAGVDDESQQVAREIAQVWGSDPSKLDATLMEWLDGRWGVRERPKVYDEALRSKYWSPTHLMALGRIAEVSAKLERLMRVALMAALDLQRDTQDVDAVTTGMRFGEMQRLLERLSVAVANSSKKRDRRRAVWLPQFLHWAAGAARLIAERDSVIHRPPMILFGDDHREAKYASGVGRSRKAHVVEVVDEHGLIDLVRRMEEGHWAGWEMLFGDVIVEGGVVDQLDEGDFGRRPMRPGGTA